MIEIVLDNKIYKVVIEYKKNKNLYVRIDDELNIHVSCNRFFPKNKILTFIEENKEKIKKMYDQKVRTIEKSARFYYMTKPYDIIIDKKIKKYIIDSNNNIIYIKNTKSLTDMIVEIITGYVNEIMPLIKEDIPDFKLRFRSMKTKWGVCNRANNTITLNYNLIGQSADFIKYVIIHEICHFTVFNHSKVFYTLVSKYMPEYKQVIKQNKEW